MLRHSTLIAAAALAAWFSVSTAGQVAGGQGAPAQGAGGGQGRGGGRGGRGAPAEPVIPVHPRDLSGYWLLPPDPRDGRNVPDAQRKVGDFAGAAGTDTGDRQHERAKHECSHQKVDPTANLKVNFFAGRRLLSSTPNRYGLYAKINRNGTFNTGMKKRISAPVEVLNALVSPILRRNGGGAFGSTSRVVVNGSRIGGRPDRPLVDVFLHREALAMSRTWPVS